MDTARAVVPTEALKPRPGPVAKATIIAFSVVSLAAVTAVHGPRLPTAVQAAGHSFTNIVGQEHPWSLFSADPRGVSLDMKAVIEFEDGTQHIWTIDRSTAGGGLRSYRWVQWMEYAVLTASRGQSEGLVLWLADSSERPVRRITVFGLQQGPAEPGDKERPPPQISVLLEIDADDINELRNRP